MSDFSPTLVLQKSIAKTPNDMAKVQIKSEKVTSFGGFFPIMEQFDALLAQTIKSHTFLLLFLKIVLSLIFKSRRPHLSDRIALFVFALSFWRLQAAES